MPERAWVLPLRSDNDHDPQAGLHAGLNFLTGSESVEIRYLLSPAPKGAAESIRRAAQRYRLGIRPGRFGLAGQLVAGAGWLVRGLAALTATVPPARPQPPDELFLQMTARADQPLLTCAILVQIRAGERRTILIARALSQALAQHASPWNRLRLKQVRSKRAAYEFAGWQIPRRDCFALSASEAAALCELPGSEARDPNLKRAAAAQVRAAAMVPRGQGLFLGWAEAGEDRLDQRYGLDIDDALKHVLTVGPTGTGKSTFQYWYAISAIESGLGMLLLDPKGDLARAVLDGVPEARAKDVAFLDFADTDRPIGLNPLAVSDPAEADQTAAAVSTMMRELITGEGMQWGTTMSQAFSYGFRTLAANPQIEPTMLDLERLFSDRQWRAELVANVDDPFVAAYWANQIDRLGERQFELNFGSALRRMAILVNDPRIRNILAQPRPAVRWDRALARSGIVLVNLDQADNALGIAGSRLLGSIIVTQFWQAVLRRPRPNRAAFICLIDEFQEFLDTGRNMGAFFERARSYRVGMCIATQTLAQPRLRPIRRTVSVNARTQVIFGGLRDEARHFALATEPYFSARDLDRRDAFQMTVSTLVKNQPAPPFSAHVAALPEPDWDRLEERRQRARALFGADRAALAERVRERYGPRAQ